MDSCLFTQRDHLDRVTSAIGNAVLAFCRSNIGREFHCDSLRAFVTAQGHAAPASPDRVLRHLRQRGLVRYVVVNRRASLYRVLEVNQ